MRKVDLDDQITLRVPRQMREAVEAKAQREERSLAQELRKLIKDGLAAAGRGAAA
jgi:hypothetical protein